MISSKSGMPRVVVQVTEDGDKLSIEGINDNSSSRKKHDGACVNIESVKELIQCIKEMFWGL